MVNLFVKDNY